MWILKGPNGETYYLLLGKHVIGRKNCDLVLDNDQSISRSHAIIEVSHPQSNWGDPDAKPILNFFDAGSKYGTSLIKGNSSIKMERDIKRNLEEGMTIHFGLQFNKWQVSYNPLAVVVSSLPKAEKQKVRTMISELGGHMVTEWHPQTTHLTMATVTMTVKAITALAHAIPIVTPAFWLSYKTAITSKTELPKCEEYVPPIGETVLNEHKVSFLINPKRKSLFNGKIFYFFSELQFKDHGSMVKAAGGVPKLVRVVRQISQYVEKNAVVMQILSTSSQTISSSQITEAASEVSDFLKLSGKRLIPASEIGLAVLHCSVEKYCNPEFNFSSMLLRGSQTSQPPVLDRILATETQENSGPNLIIGDRKVIPDSGSESKLGLSTSVEENSVVQSSQKLMPEPKPATTLSQSTEELLQNTPLLTTHNKRLRQIEESDEEVEIFSPRKIPTGANSVRQKHPEITIEDGDSDVEFSTVASTAASRSRPLRSNMSKASHHKEVGDDCDELFPNFKESKTKRSSILHQELPPDTEESDIFDGFRNYSKPSTAQTVVRVAESHESLKPSSEFVVPRSPACKRDLPPDDDESGPPEKRFANLDLSKQQDDSQDNQEENVQFMSTSCVKTEDVSFNVKPSCNVSVVFKSLIITKSKNLTVTAPETTELGIVNYKKFRKINSLSKSVIPHIIGGRDLVPYQSFAGNSSIFKDISDERNENEEEDGPDSLWGALTQSNRKQNRSRKQ